MTPKEKDKLISDALLELDRKLEVIMKALKIKKDKK